MGGGLEGVVAAETRLGHVDGAAGRLLIKGWRIEELVGQWSFEEVAGLLRAPDDGTPPERPGPTNREAARAVLGRARRLVTEWLGTQDERLMDLPAMRALPAILAAGAGAGSDEPSPDDLVALVGVVAARWCAHATARPALPADPDLSHAQDLLRLATGRLPRPAEARALDGYLACLVDHGMNASTFAARVVASTGATVAGAVQAGMVALAGPLHGGAPGPVLDMLDAVGEPDRAAAWLAAELDGGRRLMGFGHRVYRVRDPRVGVLEGLVEALDSPAAHRRLALARAVEREATRLLAERKPDRPMGANVELATAVLLEALGLPRQAFTAFFAASRVVGWIAHAEEQRRNGRLIRPTSRYVGPRPASTGVDAC